jgi:N6-L-threonylcarbamoyladenine synthase
VPPLASGIKTALWHLAQREEIVAEGSVVADLAASFQSAVVEVLVGKTIKAAKETGVGQILLSGGVAANKVLVERFIGWSPVPVVVPAPELCTDNAAMVAGCGYYHFERGEVSGYDLDVVPSLSLG